MTGKVTLAIIRFILVIVTLASNSVHGFDDEKADPSLLTLQRIYADNEFNTQSFSGRWLRDKSGYTTLEKSEQTESGHDIVFHSAADGTVEIMVPASRLIPPKETVPLEIEDYTWSDDLSKVLVYTNSKRVWRRNTRGDYWVLDRASHVLRRLGGEAPDSSLMFAKFSPNGQYVAYVLDGDIYLEDLMDHSIRRLTVKQSPEIVNGTFDWVYEEELGLRDGFRWSPDSHYIAYWQINTEGVQRVPLVNNTDRLYPKITWIPYPKAGQQNSACRIGVLDVCSGKTKWINMPGDPRDNYIARMEWAENSHQLLVQRLNRLQNANRVMLVDVPAGKMKTIFVERDDAWVDIHDELIWIDDGLRFTWISQRDGWRHVYLVSRNGDEVTQVTSGEFDVIELLHVDQGANWVYFAASPNNATRRFLYRVRLDGSELARWTPDEISGTNTYRISPNADWAFYTHSSMESPPKTALIDLRSHQAVRVLQDNMELRDKITNLKWPETEFLRVAIGDGVELDGWCIAPPDLDTAGQYPLLVYVYGEPAGQTVLDRWGSRHFLWHAMLAQRGYVVVSFDNRGTPAPRGRAWRKHVYRKVGILAPQDQAAAVRAILKERPYLDPSRVGVWGWSGGGSMTLNAILKYPELYGTAISIAPVPNQRYYDTIYQERYMGLPSDNVDGYLRGSTVNYADRLQGNLLLIHGTGDDNCHYQGTEALVNELIRHNRRFTMMAYPNRSHAIREGKNTTLHLRELMTRYLMENLPSGNGQRD